MKKLIYAFLFLALFTPLSANAFSDLPTTDKHYGSLTYLEYEDVINGYSDGTVRPNNKINRKEIPREINCLGRNSRNNLSLRMRLDESGNLSAPQGLEIHNEEFF